ncbi:MAG: FtsW/RodA/SpoVE family cell cycle protein [Porphyromonas sp.]|nr:FtsW/RodA/SpoVE family cell cycle protein [Porphyromonas sp.]
MNIPVETKNPLDSSGLQSQKKLFAGDKTLWMIIALLMIMSLLSVYSAISNEAFAHNSSVFAPMLKHVGLMVMGLIVCVVFSHIPTKLWRRFALFGLLLGIALLILTQFMGIERNGGKRWLSILGFEFQTSEIARLCLINYIAFKLSVEEYASKRTFIHIALATGAICIPIFLQNISSGLLLGMTAYVLCFLGKVHMRTFIKATVAMIVGAVLLVALLLILPMDVVNKIPGRFGTGKARIESFIGKNEKKELADDDGKSFQRIQANIAIVKGGVTGVGPGNSESRLVLPQPFSDFIFVIILEEYGLFAGLLCIALYIWLLFYIGKLASRLKLFYPKFLVIGIGIIICTQALIHMMVNVGIMPVTGQTLPFISKGGSSYLVTSVYFALILSASRELEEQREVAIAQMSGGDTPVSINTEIIPEVPITDASYYDDEKSQSHKSSKA